mmetsp:Transcript_10600/g.44185  ORF Transcript_10600/g.44185 Transcript_10600/m.44185 type:complete len:213 (+) Transcript_10600:3590-4228(+)
MTLTKFDLDRRMTRVMYGMAQIFSGTMLLSRLDAQATYACCVLNVLDLFARSILRQSIWTPAIVLWVVFTLLILRRELKRLLGLRREAAKGKATTTPATAAKKKGFVKISEKSSASSSARIAPSCVRHYAIVFPFACTRTPVYYLTFLGDRALSEGYVMQPYAQPKNEEFAVHSKSDFSRCRQCARIHPFLWPNTRLKSLLPYCQFNTPKRI